MQLYNTVVTVWASDTECVTIPVLGVFADKEAAKQNALGVALALLTAHRPDLLESKVTTLVVAQPDNEVRELIARLAQHRPDLLKPEKVKRGKQG